jgi:hypothetical protein
VWFNLLRPSVLSLTPHPLTAQTLLRAFSPPALPLARQHLNAMSITKSVDDRRPRYDHHLLADDLTLSLFIRAYALVPSRSLPGLSPIV